MAGVDLKGWSRMALSSTEELDYAEALDWFGLRFASSEEPVKAWRLEILSDATGRSKGAPSRVVRIRRPPNLSREPDDPPMKSAFRFLASPSPCGYLPQQTQRLEYEVDPALDREGYLGRMNAGWRRFGYSQFRPRCPACNACRPLRVAVDRFRPDRSQRRVLRRNEGSVLLHVGDPVLTRSRLDLYDRFHAYQSSIKGWPLQVPRDADDYRLSFIDHPFPTQEWTYELDGRLVGVGFVDDLPAALSAIYFVHDPGHRDRSLGTWNILSLIAHAEARGIPHVYLGYFVAGCRSMEYKARFVPNQVLDPDGKWVDFRT